MNEYWVWELACLKSHESMARGPSRHTARVWASPSSRTYKKLLHPSSPLWLGFIVAYYDNHPP